MKRNHKPYIFWIAISEAVGALSGFLSRGGMRYYSESVIQPPLSPPPIVFPIVWGVLYALMGVGAARISRTEDRKGLNLFIAQLVVNFFWSLIFFNLRAYGFALAWLCLLWALVAWMILQFNRTDPLAAWIQVPYLLWLTFAAYLNAGTWVLN